MIDFHRRSGHLAAILHTPGERIEPRVNRAGRATPIVEAHGAEADDGAERALPGEARQGDRNVRIVLEIQSGGARRGLKLIHGQLPDEADAVIAQMPAGAVVIRGSREGSPAKN